MMWASPFSVVCILSTSKQGCLSPLQFSTSIIDLLPLFTITELTHERKIHFSESNSMNTCFLRITAVCPTLAVLSGLLYTLVLESK